MKMKREVNSMDKRLFTYRKMDTAGKTMPRLLVEVYDGTVKFLRQAKDAYQKGDNNAGFESLEKVRTVMVHLYTTLDNDKGGEIAEKLGHLYAFIIGQIDLIEATKDEKVIDNCIEILNNIREGWEQLARNIQEQAGDKKEPPATDLPSDKKISVSV